MNPTSASSKKSNSLSDKDDNEHGVADMDECELQALLEEAMNYKKPSDIETKSECFKKLLKSATEEDERRNLMFEQLLPKKRTSRNQHGGSLQDLPEALSNDLYGNAFHHNNYGTVGNSSTHGSGSKKHSRRKHSSTSSSSVSSRQREGGSLPNNVNMPSPVDQFISDYRTKTGKKIGGKFDGKLEKAHTVIDMGDVCDPDEKLHLLAHDSLGLSTQQQHGGGNNEGGIEMKPMSYTNSLNLEIGTAGDLSKKPLRSTTAQSSASTITTYMTTNTTITSPAITGAKSSTTSSMTASSAAGPVLSVDKGIEFSIEKPKSYQQQNHVFLTEASNNIILANAGSYNGPTLGTAGISGGALKSAVDATPVQLQNYSSVSSLVDRNSYQKNVFQLTGQRLEDTLIPTSSLVPGNPVVTSALSSQSTAAGGASATAGTKKEPKKRSNKHERNVTTFTADTIQGCRGNEDLDSLLSFIENNSNKEDKKEAKPKNGILNSELLNSENTNNNKLKKTQTKNNKEKSEIKKLKKCSSLEELSSANRNCHKEATTTQNNNNNKTSAESNANTNSVTLRSKSSNNNNNNTNNKENNKENKKSVEKVNNKRNERRSWGTEELNYLGESSMELQKKTETLKSTREPRDTRDPKESKDLKDQKELKDQEKKNTSDSSASSSSGAFESLSIVSIEPIASNTMETAEFHVVTKKRKTKKRTNEEIHASVKIQAHQFPGKRENYQNRSSNYKQQGAGNSGKSDGKSEGKTGKNRRKSTSSVPPSEKSDDSDMDSVHSLPIKSTKSMLSQKPVVGASAKPANNNLMAQKPVVAAVATVAAATAKVASNVLAGKAGTQGKQDENAKNPNKRDKEKDKVIVPLPVPPVVPIVAKAAPSSQISYADMAKKTSNNVNNSNLISSSNKLDKTNNSSDQWPSVSSTGRLGPELVVASFPFGGAGGATTPPAAIPVLANNQNSSLEKKKQAKLTFPELVESNNTKNKMLNNCVEQEVILGQDSNNNEPKKTIISYSQSLLDDNGNVQVVQEEKLSTLHKSRSFEQPVVVDPFPALEKTLAKQQSQKSLNEQMKLTQKQVNGAKKAKSPNGKIGNGPVCMKNSASSPGNLENQEKVEENCDEFIEVKKNAGNLENMEMSENLVENPWNNHENSENLRESFKNSENAWKNAENTRKILHNTENFENNGNPGHSGALDTSRDQEPAWKVHHQETSENSWKNPVENQQMPLENGDERKVGTKKERKIGGLTNGRPAVIMAGYSKQQTEEGIGNITFGFDIDEHLLHSSDEEEAAGKGLETISVVDNNKIKLNNCDINLNSSSNCNELDGDGLEEEQEVEEENFIIVNNASSRLSSNLIKNQSSPKLQQEIVAQDQELTDQHNKSVLEMSQVSSDLGYASLVTNPSPKQAVPQEIKQQQGENDDISNHLTNDGHSGEKQGKNLNCNMLPTLPVFIQPDTLQSFTFNHEKIVHFVGEEWDKFIRNGVKYFEEL